MLGVTGTFLPGVRVIEAAIGNARPLHTPRHTHNEDPVEDYMKTLFGTAAILAISTAGAFAQTADATTETDGMMNSDMTTYDVAVYDADADGMLNETEFGDSMTAGGIFAAVDANSDGFLTSDEYNSNDEVATLLRDYDGDGDSQITEAEFNTALFGKYDANQDGAIDATEGEMVRADASEGGMFYVDPNTAGGINNGGTASN